MLQIRILNSGVYRFAQKSVQTTHAVFLGLSVRGCVRSTLYDPEGKFISAYERAKSGPKNILSLVPAGFRSEFEYDETRENWVIMLAFPAFEYLPKTQEFCWKYNGKTHLIPRTIPIRKQELPGLREKFERITELHQSGLPRNQLEAELIVTEILQYFLREPIHQDDPAELLRKKLSGDCRKEFSISSFSRELGISRDELRKKFTERYGITPGEYHIRVRLGKILNLFAYSDMNLKEIAFSVGMKNLSHLTTFVRSRCGKLPSELCREFRRKTP